MTPESFTFDVAAQGTVTALVYRAREPLEATLILAHGAGAPQTHPFMVGMARRIAELGADVVTFNFLYTERGKRAPDPSGVLESCWRAAIASVRARGGLPTERLFCGGKSMGGRMASHVAAADAGLVLGGLVFLGYPLHPAGKPRVRRDAHLFKVPFPMLFVQGSRDELGDAREIRDLAAQLPNAIVHVVEGGDHSLALLKREGTERQEHALAGAARAVVDFVQAPPRASTERA